MLATCCDVAHPPEHAIDGQKGDVHGMHVMTANSEASCNISPSRPSAGTFWATTGMFPQELAISMSSTAAVNKVELEGVNSEPLACLASCLTLKVL